MIHNKRPRPQIEGRSRGPTPWRGPGRKVGCLDLRDPPVAFADGRKRYFLFWTERRTDGRFRARFLTFDARLQESICY